MWQWFICQILFRTYQRSWSTFSVTSTSGLLPPLKIWPFSLVHLGKLWRLMSSSCSPEFMSCDPLHSGALVSHGSWQFGNQSCLTCYFFFMPGIFQTVTKMLSFFGFSSAVAEKTFSGSVKQVRDHNKLSSVYLNYNAFTWLTKPPNTLLDIIIEVLMVFYLVCCQKVDQFWYYI